MKCWNCGIELFEEELDIDPIPMTDSVTGEKTYDCYCPHCGVVIGYLTEEEIWQIWQTGGK